MERVCCWPDGDWCYEADLEEHLEFKSDDFQYIPSQFFFIDEETLEVSSEYTNQNAMKPIGPPNRSYRETLLGFLVETEESKQATRIWNERRNPNKTKDPN